MTPTPVPHAGPPPWPTLGALLAERSVRSGDRLAVAGPDGRRTFAELWEGAAGWATTLGAADPGRVTAVETHPHRVAQIEACAALLVAGRPALVLDPAAPASLRRRWLTQGDDPLGLGDPPPPGPGPEAPIPPGREVDVAEVAIVQPALDPVPGTLRWHTHGDLVRQAAVDASRLGLVPGDRVAALVPLSTPFGLRTLLAAWHAGAATALYDPRGAAGWSGLVGWLASERVTVAPVTTAIAALAGLDGSDGHGDRLPDLPHLRALVFGDPTVDPVDPVAPATVEVLVLAPGLEPRTVPTEPAPTAAEPPVVGGVGPGPADAPEDPVEATLTAIWGELLGVDPATVAHDRDFFEMGGHSLLAARMLVLLEQRTGVTLPMAVFLDATTIAELAAVARSGPAGDVALPLVTLQAGDGARPPLFLTHDLQGSAWRLRPLARAVGADRPVFGFESPMLEGHLPFATIEALAAHYVAAMRTVQPEGPYHVAGYSFGGILAFEMARVLRRHGDEVSVLGVIDVGPGYRGVAYSRTDLPSLPYLTDAVDRGPGLLPGWARPVRRLWLNRPVLVARWRRRLARGAAVPPDERLWFAWWAHWNLVGPQWAPSPYGGRIDLFWAHTTAVTDPTMGWADHAGSVVVHRIAGHHESLMEPPAVDEIGARLGRLTASPPG